MSENIKLRNVRLSFPNLFEYETYEGKSREKYSGTFLIPKSDTKTIQIIQSAVDGAIQKAGLKKLPITSKICFRDGDETERGELQGHYSLKATTKIRPTVIHNAANNKEIITKQDETIYSGCYVNALIDSDFYCYMKGDKGVSANLLGVQFVRDGDPFAAGRVADIEEFEEFDDLDDDEEEL